MKVQFLPFGLRYREQSKMKNLSHNFEEIFFTIQVSLSPCDIGQEETKLFQNDNTNIECSKFWLQLFTRAEYLKILCRGWQIIANE
jgi:hypothetical protein